MSERRPQRSTMRFLALSRRARVRACDPGRATSSSTRIWPWRPSRWWEMTWPTHWRRTSLRLKNPRGAPSLAMKDRRHTQWHLLASHERHERLRETFAQGDNSLYVIDDGRTHAMIGHLVGSSPSCTYSLVGRVSTRRHSTKLQADGRLPITEAFNTANRAGCRRPSRGGVCRLLERLRRRSLRQPRARYPPGPAGRSTNTAFDVRPRDHRLLGLSCSPGRLEAGRGLTIEDPPGRIEVTEELRGADHRVMGAFEDGGDRIGLRRACR